MPGTRHLTVSPLSDLAAAARQLADSFAHLAAAGPDQVIDYQLHLARQQLTGLAQRAAPAYTARRHTSHTGTVDVQVYATDHTADGTPVLRYEGPTAARCGAVVLAQRTAGSELFVHGARADLHAAAKLANRLTTEDGWASATAVVVDGAPIDNGD